MKKIFYYINILGALWLTSCNEELEVESEDSTDVATSDLGFSSYGYRSVELVSIYDTYEYTMEVTYSDGDALTLSLEVDESALTEYNSLYETSYEVLPTDYYEMPTSLNWTEESATFSIVFNTQKLIEDLGATAASNYVLPIMINTDDADVVLNSQMTKALLHVEVNDPTITVGQYELSITLDDTTEVADLAFEALFNVESFDATQLDVSVAQSEVDTYNSQNGTEYLLLPETNYSYQGVSVDNETQEMSLDFEVYADGLDWTTYVLPAKLSSSLYDIDGSDVFYYVITINRTAPEYLATYTISVAQPVNNEYAYVQTDVDLSEPAAVFGISEDELLASIAFYGVNSDETLYKDGYTANNGYWYDGDGDVTSWGADGCALFVEFSSEESSFHFGQFPSYATAWDSYTVSMALVYEGSYIKYSFTYDILPEFLASYELSVDQSVSVADYATVSIEYDFSEAASLFGITEDELSSGMYFYSLSGDGSLATAYTGNTGFWYDNEGSVVSWGTDGCSLFVEYGGDGIFNVGQYPSANSAGDSYTVNILMVYNDQMISYDITLNITD